MSEAVAALWAAVETKADTLITIIGIGVAILTAFLLPTVSAYFAWQREREKRGREENNRKHSDYVNARQEFKARHIESLQKIIEGATDARLKIRKSLQDSRQYDPYLVDEHIAKYKGVALLYPSTATAIKAFEDFPNDDDSFNNLVRACEDVIQSELLLIASS